MLFAVHNLMVHMVHTCYPFFWAKKCLYIIWCQLPGIPVAWTQVQSKGIGFFYFFFFLFLSIALWLRKAVPLCLGLADLLVCLGLGLLQNITEIWFSFQVLPLDLYHFCLQNSPCTLPVLLVSLCADGAVWGCSGPCSQHVCVCVVMPGNPRVKKDNKLKQLSYPALNSFLKPTFPYGHNCIWKWWTADVWMTSCVKLVTDVITVGFSVTSL